MTWKAWLVLVVLAALGGFWYGNHRLGAKAAAQATAAVQQINQLGAQVANEMQIRKTKELLLKDAQVHQQTADAKVQSLTRLLATRKKPLAPVPATGPVTPPATEPEPFITTDSIKDDLIAAQSQDIAELKTVVAKQADIIATDNIIIPQMQKEIALGKIALDAQISATKASKWSGRFQGAGLTIGFAGAIGFGAHFIK